MVVVAEDLDENKPLVAFVDIDLVVVMASEVVDADAYDGIDDDNLAVVDRVDVF